MQKDLEKTLNNYSPFIIETALVQLFIDSNNLTVKKNELIRSLLENKSEEILKAKEFLINKIETKNIIDFVNIFELLIPLDDKKNNGAFFTPSNITDFIVSETIDSRSQRILDPSCGCGAFLISATDFIAKKYNKSVTKTIEENIFGVDIAKYSIKRAKILLSLLALKNNEDKKEIKFNLKTKDSLTTDWKKLFPEIKNGFDVVIGNPPYVKFQDLNEDLRKSLSKNWQTLNTGNYNLYFAFFELGISVMKNTGVLGYITPNNYFTSLAGIHLREFLESNRLIEKIIDFNHFKVFDAQTYTSISFLSKGNNVSFDYEKIDDCAKLNSLKKLQYSKINFSDLNNKKWRLLRHGDQENIKKIENIGRKLGDIVKIRVGVATCKDSVYFVDGSTFDGKYLHKSYNGKDYFIEKDITQSIAKISDFKAQDDLGENNRRIIFPYRKKNRNVEIIEEDKLKKKYPYCYKYLMAAKSELASRDKGAVNYPEWYAYARTQGLNFLGKKLLTPTFSSKPRFLLEKNENTLFCNGYAIYLDNRPSLFYKTEQKLNLSILSKILNSSIMEYYIKQTSVSIDGGYPCYQKNFIELLGIPDFTSNELGYLNREKDGKLINDFLTGKYGVQI